MPKRKLSPVIYKKTKNFKKFIEKTKQNRLQAKTGTSTSTDNKTSPSSTTPMTNDECKTLVKRREELQINDNGCDYFKMMNTKETTMSTTCDDNVKDEDDNENDNIDGGNKQSVANKKCCYASISANKRESKGNGKVDALNACVAADDGLNDADDCCDDTNNHSNNNGNNKTTRVINDNNTNVASNENNSNRSNTKSYGKLNGNYSYNSISNNEKKQQHHKLSNKTNDTDGNHDDDNNDVVDNCNVDNVKYNKHHKTSKILQTTTTTTTTHDSRLIQSTTHMPLHMKQEHANEISSLPTMSSLTSTVNSSSTWPTTMTMAMTTATWHESCENHKIKNCETVHHQPQSSTQENGHIQNSIVQQLDTFVSNYKVKINYDQNSTGHRESTSATATTTTTNSLSKCELASPRCQSRESTASASANNDARCPSNESHYSGNDGHTTPAQTPTPTTPPVGLPLPATLAPAAAAALLPPQSAAMAAYFNAAAAAAAQQNHLLLTNPLAAAASLVQQATQQAAHSPNTPQTLTPTPPNRADLVDASALDFSTKRSRRQSDDDDDAIGGSEDEEDGADDGERNDNEADKVNDNEAEDLNSPLDLSVNNGRKRQSDEEEPALISNRKLARSNDYKSLPASSTWVPPINPYLAAVAAANMSPKTSLSMDWNTKAKIAPNEATKALEKMTEMTRLGGSSKSDHTEASNRNTSSSSSSSLPTATTSTTSNGRHSAWQSHWLNKGADAVKDVFKCVWCKQSFATLASLTTHMKETQHCGVNVPPSVTAANSGTSSNSGGNQTTQSSHHSRHSTTQSNATASAQIAANNAATSGGSKSDLNMLIKETMPLPRKLVRGQDVWLGKGAEQTRQILKCMWCGQSFRSLAEMTSHMQETQHYTNIISQEQIISWKSSDEKTSRDNSSSSSSGNRGLSANTAAISTSNTVPENDGGNNSVSPNTHAANANSTVSAVLTCKVCDQAFSTLKELSNHMVKNNHYKEHMIRTATVTENVPTMIRGRGRQTREKRKKSLPVRKLLEMERAQHDFKSAGLDQALKPLRDFAVSTKLACETCGDKVETAMFVDHIRQCIDKSLILSPRSQNNNNNNNTIKTPYGPSTPQDRLNSPQTPHSRSDGRKTSDGNISPLSTTTTSNTRADILCPLPPDADKTTSSTSVLSALEQLIEKSFDSRPRHSSNYGDGSSAGTPLGSSILKRLGIDDNIDYTKPLMDQQTMQFLRSYSNYPSNRDRSASESSSISERCSSRLESFTPDRCHDLSRQPTPRLTPDKNVQMPKEPRDSMYGTKIKSEPIDSSDQQIPDNDNTAIHEMPKKISVKKEFNIPEEQEDYEHNKIKEASDMRHSSLTPSSRAISPNISERSLTPKSTCSTGEKKSSSLGLTESSSLNALSSMFHNLSNMTNTTLTSSANIETNNNNTASMMPKKMNANPLAALQKLCDTTDTPASNTRSSSANHNVLTHSNTAVSTSSNVSGGGGANNASMLAFSWACNDAVVTADSIIKCSFCDTPFSSKGAYRHHLSKVHFVKDDHAHEMNNMKSPASLAAISPKSLTSPKSVTSSKSPAVQQQRLEATPPSSVATTPTINPYDESPQSKFLKYTELAKQLSSKNA